MHMVKRGRAKRGILYQLARGIQPVQTWLPWFPLFTLKSPETLFAKMTSECYWERGGRPLTPVSILYSGPRGWRDVGGAALLACRYRDPVWILCFLGYVLVSVDGNWMGFRLLWSGGYHLSFGALVLVDCSKWLGRSFSSSQFGHTNGQGASNPGAPCSPFSPLGPFLPFFPFSPCGYNDWVTMTSFFNSFLNIQGTGTASNERWGVIKQEEGPALWRDQS